MCDHACVGLGAQYSLSERTKIGFDYELSSSGDLDMDRSSTLGGDLVSSYEDVYMNVLALNAVLSF